MKKGILLIGLLILITTNAFAQPKTIYKIDIAKSGGLQKFYRKNIKTANDQQILIVPRGTMYCGNYKAYIRGYKYILGGGNSIAGLESVGCGLIGQGTNGLIIEAFEGSQAVVVAYRLSSMTDQIVISYFNYATLITKANYNAIK